jgi:hypothetical protein
MATAAIEAPVVQVQLAEDRAQVVRRGTFETPKEERYTLIIENVSPVIVDSTVQCRLLKGRGTVVDCLVKRRARIEAAEKPARIAALEQAIEEKAAEQELLSAELNILNLEMKAEEETFALTLEELAEDVSWGRGDEKTWGALLDTVDSPEKGNFERLFQLERAKSECTKEIQDFKTKLSALTSPDAELGAEIAIDLLVERQERETIAVELTYVVPNACWRPRYRAELIDGTKRMRFQCDGTIWQNTGEDWTDVAVIFSTERASLGVAPPHLESDLLLAERAEDLIQVEAREEAIVKSGLGKTDVITELPGIDDGGEVLCLKGERRTTVRSNGRPQRIAIFEFESDSECRLQLYAELEESVLLVSEQTNRSPHPILPGPVDLIRNRGIVGRSEITYISPDERFALGFGPEDSLRVVREKEVLRQKEKALSSWIVSPYRVHIYLSNLSRAPKRIAVRERVLVSEIDKIRVVVDDKKTTDGKQPDENGFIDWDIKLAGKGRETIRLAFEVKRHANVVGLTV